MIVHHEEHYGFTELLAGPAWLHESIKGVAIDGDIITTEFRDTWAKVSGTRAGGKKDEVKPTSKKT